MVQCRPEGGEVTSHVWSGLVEMCRVQGELEVRSPGRMEGGVPHGMWALRSLGDLRGSPEAD